MSASKLTIIASAKASAPPVNQIIGSPVATSVLSERTRRGRETPFLRGEGVGAAPGVMRLELIRPPAESQADGLGDRVDDERHRK